DTRAAAIRGSPPEVRVPRRRQGCGANSGAHADHRRAAVHRLRLGSAGENHATEIARNAWGRTGSSAGEHDAAKAAVYRLAEHTGDPGQRKDNGERFHGKPPDGIVPLRQANRGDRVTFSSEPE